jgi:acetolactate synthase-1/3 small subunit
MSDIVKRHVIGVIVDNEFGALARIVELFSARGCNIETLTVAPISFDKKLSRITITSYSTNKTNDLICKLLRRIIPVHNAAELSCNEGYIERELALIHIITDEENRQKAMNAIEKYRSNVLEILDDSVVFEVIGTSQIIDEVIEILNNYGLSSISRTGIAAGFSGSKKLAET